MAWIAVVSGYLLGSIPTAYILGRLLKGKDIRQLGDGNMGARNSYHELGPKVGIAVFFIDAAKGALAVVIALVAGLPQVFVLTTGAVAVIGHNWPVFAGFRGGRGESTTIGVLLTLVPLPALIVAGPTVATLVIRKNVTIASCVMFMSLPLVCWALGVPGLLIAYSIELPCLVGLTHFLKTRRTARISSASST
jgi:glycerol-3-phosphate acyltransferase PlsY